MAKSSYRCLACQNEVEREASTCSNPACKRPLAFCSQCRDVTTFTAVEGRRQRFRCDRCDAIGVRCLTRTMGFYCNGLARGGLAALCANCSVRVGEIGRTLASTLLLSALGNLLRKR